MVNLNIIYNIFNNNLNKNTIAKHMVKIKLFSSNLFIFNLLLNTFYYIFYSLFIYILKYYLISLFLLRKPKKESFYYFLPTFRVYPIFIMPFFGPKRYLIATFFENKYKHISWRKIMALFSFFTIKQWIII